ncbi:MAG: DNA ligase (NAD(+)) LigA, partial [Bacteroidota bacterium]
MYTPAEQKALFDRSKAYLNQQTIPTDVDEQLGELRQLLMYHEHRYYVLNEPVLSDKEYDELYKQLERLEDANPELITPDSPTQRVGSDLSGDFQSVPHLIPMLSLGNSYNADDLTEFDKQVKRMLNLPEEVPLAYAVEPKYDGGSIALVYENDQLVRAATRGNGTEGEEITGNARVIRSIPLAAHFSRYGLRKVELRGEVIIQKEKFTQMNEARAKAGQSLFANPRNTATGGLRMKSPTEVSQRGLEAFVYSFGYAEDMNGRPALDQFATHTEALDALTALGFKVPQMGYERKRCKNIDEAAVFCRQWEEQREAYGYEIDGMVVKGDALELQEGAGFTSR